jgi:hypothetical protein
VIRRGRRDSVEAEVVRAFIDLGCTVWRIDRPVDLLVGCAGRNYLVEVKSGTSGYGKALNGNQALFSETWRGGRVFIARSQADAAALVQEWRKA